MVATRTRARAAHPPNDPPRRRQTPTINLALLTIPAMEPIVSYVTYEQLGVQFNSSASTSVAVWAPPESRIDSCAVRQAAADPWAARERDFVCKGV